MVKVITIRDDVYKKLLSIKHGYGFRSFSQTIDWLIENAKKGLKAGKVTSLAGILEGGDLRRDRLWRLKDVKDMLRP